MWCDESLNSLLNSSITYKHFIFYVSFLHDELFKLILYITPHRLMTPDENYMKKNILKKLIHYYKLLTSAVPKFVLYMELSLFNDLRVAPYIERAVMLM